MGSNEVKPLWRATFHQPTGDDFFVPGKAVYLTTPEVVSVLRDEGLGPFNMYAGPESSGPTEAISRNDRGEIRLEMPRVRCSLYGRGQEMREKLILLVCGRWAEVFFPDAPPDTEVLYHETDPPAIVYEDRSILFSHLQTYLMLG